MILEARCILQLFQQVWKKRPKVCMEWEFGPQFNKATKHMLGSKA